MLVWPDGHALGTIGGGVLEGEVIRAARQRLAAGEMAPCLRRVSLNAEAAADDGMACGGEVTVLIEMIG
jgi:xanthine dehydrogenase accessory factor